MKKIGYLSFVPAYVVVLSVFLAIGILGSKAVTAISASAPISDRKTVIIDAGHGGVNPGAVYEGRQEKDDNLALVLAIGPILENNGIDVLYTRTTDVYQTPFQKAQLANEAGVDFFVSIHRNSFPEENVVSGVEGVVYALSGL